MPDRKGNLTKNEMMDTGCPCFIPDAPGAITGRWYGEPPLDGIILTRRRCAALGAPVRDREYPVACLYRVEIKDDYRYVPFYHRQPEQLDLKKTTFYEDRWLKRQRPVMTT